MGIENNPPWQTRHNLNLLVSLRPELELKETPTGTVLLNTASPIDPEKPTLCLDLDDFAIAYHQSREARDLALAELLPGQEEKIKECDVLSRPEIEGEKVYSVITHICLLSYLINNPDCDLPTQAASIQKKDQKNPGVLVKEIDPQIAQIFSTTTYNPKAYEDTIQLILWLQHKNHQEERPCNLLIVTYGGEEFQAFKSMGFACLGKDCLSPAVQGFVFPRKDKGIFFREALNNDILPEGRYVLADDSRRHVEDFIRNGFEALIAVRPGAKNFDEERSKPDALILPPEAADYCQEPDL